MNSLAKLKPIVIQPTQKHTATLFFLHGSGDTGNGVKVWLKSLLGKDLVLPHVRVVYPTAPLRPYSAASGLPYSVWFDRLQISPFADDHVESLEEMCRNMRELIQLEIKNGIPLNRIVLGGFSMGGSFAMYYGYQHGRNLAGIFGLSSFLNHRSPVYETLKSSNAKWPPLFQAYGENDPLVLPEWVRATSEKLESLGAQCTLRSYPQLYHEMNLQEITDWVDWLKVVLPPTR